jgi:mono/diheme cytochrome c family protein
MIIMSMRQASCRTVALTVGALVLSGSVATAALAQTSQSASIARGLAIVQENCSRCHAVGSSDASPLAKAPPFRELHKKYNVEGLAEALAEGIVTGHGEMPAFAFDPPDVDAIIQYLKSLE